MLCIRSCFPIHLLYSTLLHTCFYSISVFQMQDSMNTDDTGYITEPDMQTSAESDSIHFKDIPSPISRATLSQSKCWYVTVWELFSLTLCFDLEIHYIDHTLSLIRSFVTQWIQVMCICEFVVHLFGVTPSHWSAYV